MNEVALLNQTHVNVWDSFNLSEIKQIFAPKLTDSEFKIFVEMGKITNLNPFLKEIWAVKYGDNAQIFIGRDGYRKSAQKNPNYDYHHVDAVYSNDNFHYDMIKGEVTHTYNFKERGKLVGAYAYLKKHNASRPTYVFVDLNEYDTGKSLWVTKKATMIKKVAEAQVFRMGFQELFAGTYSPEEYDEDSNVNKNRFTSVPVNKVLPKNNNIIEGEVVEESPLIKLTFDKFKSDINNATTLDRLKEIYEQIKSSEIVNYVKYKDELYKLYTDVKMNIIQERELNASQSP